MRRTLRILVITNTLEDEIQIPNQKCSQIQFNHSVLLEGNSGLYIYSRSSSSLKKTKRKDRGTLSCFLRTILRQAASGPRYSSARVPSKFTPLLGSRGHTGKTRCAKSCISGKRASPHAPKLYEESTTRGPAEPWWSAHFRVLLKSCHTQTTHV